jgi:hypothetical protein
LLALRPPALLLASDFASRLLPSGLALAFLPSGLAPGPPELSLPPFPPIPPPPLPPSLLFALPLPLSALSPSLPTTLSSRVK